MVKENGKIKLECADCGSNNINKIINEHLTDGFTLNDIVIANQISEKFFRNQKLKTKDYITKLKITVGKKEFKKLMKNITKETIFIAIPITSLTSSLLNIEEDIIELIGYINNKDK